MSNWKLRILATLVASAAVAQSGAEEEEGNPTIEYRQSYMAAVGGHFGATRHMIGGEVAHEGHVLMHAETLARMTQDIALLFPEGSGTGETSAKPEIWENWQEFEERAAAAADAAQAFLAAARTGERPVISEAFRDLGRSCRDCHKSFRRRHEH